LLLAVLAAVLGFTASRAKQVAQQRRSEAEGLMGFMLGDFADKLRPLGKLDLLDGISTKALEYLAVSDGGELSSASLTQRAKALQVIGEVRITRGDPKAAQEALSAAQSILLKLLAANPKNIDALKEIGANYFWLGQIKLDQNEWQEAKHFFEEYRDYTDRLNKLQPNDVDTWIEQSYAHNSLGTLALRLGDSLTAASEFQVSIDLKTKAEKEKPQDRILASELADSLSWAGSTKETVGELQAAEILYTRELKVLNELHQAAPGDLLWVNRMAVAIQHKANLHRIQGQNELARQEYLQAETLLKSNMIADPDNREWQGNLALVQLNIIDISGDSKEEKNILPSLFDLRKKNYKFI